MGWINVHDFLNVLKLFQFSFSDRVALSLHITALPRGLVDGVSAGVPPHRAFTLLFKGIV